MKIFFVHGMAIQVLTELLSAMGDRRHQSTEIFRCTDPIHGTKDSRATRFSNSTDHDPATYVAALTAFLGSAAVS